MKIIHFLRDIDLEHGGVVRAVLDIATVMAGRGHEVLLATCNPKDVPTSWSAPDAKAPRVITVPTGSNPLALLPRSAIAKVGEALRDADALHLHAPWETANLQIAAAARRRNVPYVLSVHGMLDEWSMAQSAIKKRVYLALAGRRMLSGASVIHCTAEHEKTQASRWIPAQKARVIPLVFDLDPFRELPGPDLARRAFTSAATDGPAILFLSRLHPKKGIELFIETVDLLNQRGVLCTGLIAGAGEASYESGLRREVDRRGLDQRVHFLGMVGGDQKLSLYQRAEVFLLPTSQENFGFVLPESLACATPVVTTRGVDIWPELESSGGARIIEREADAITETVADLLSDQERLRAMGEKGRAWVFDHLDPQRVASEYERLYEDLRSVT